KHVYEDHVQGKASKERKHLSFGPTILPRTFKKEKKTRIILISAKQEYGAQCNKYNNSHYSSDESMVRAILASQRIGICKRMKNSVLASLLLSPEVHIWN
ncbi:mCG145828, partial [Mus musculus]